MLEARLEAEGYPLDFWEHKNLEGLACNSSSIKEWVTKKMEEGKITNVGVAAYLEFAHYL